MEVPHVPDILLDQTPTLKDYKILPGERLLTPEPPFPTRLYPEHPSSLKQLLRLTGAAHANEIGDHGPAQAATYMPGPDNNHKHLHLFEAVFGRDSLRVADSVLHLYPKLTRSTLLTLAKLQGVYFDEAREEEPGGIPHEIRDLHDPIAIKLSKERGWDWPYYGTTDATPEFVRLLSKYLVLNENHRAFLSESYTDRAGVERTMRDALDNAIAWIERRRALNPEGLIEYKAKIPFGIENQAWKDSFDSYHHADGTIANHNQGIASIEIQVAAYEALLGAASIYDQIHAEHASALRDEAASLKRAIFTHFWTEDRGGYFVIGTDRDDNGTLRQLKIRTSNMGHVLNSSLLEGDDPALQRMRDAVVNQLLSPEMLACAGIRTLASDEVRFRPGAYHNGTVWLWDSHYIANGLRRHGFTEAAEDLDQRMMTVIETTRIFPEYVRGEQHHIALNHQIIKVWDETMQQVNIVEQPPQEVQAWTVAAVRDYKSRVDRMTPPSYTSRNAF